MHKPYLLHGWTNIQVMLGVILLLFLFPVNASTTSSSDSALPFSQNQNMAVFQFKTPEDEHRAFYLARHLRCPKCQNQNLMESNASIAVDMKYQVYLMVDQGKSNEEILTFMTDRFGQFVLYQPPFSYQTALLWLLPLLLLFLLAWGVWRLSKKNPRPQA